MAICGAPPPSGGVGYVCPLGVVGCMVFLLGHPLLTYWSSQMCGGGAVGGAPDPSPSKGVRPNKSARPRNTAVTTAATGKMRPQSPTEPHLEGLGRLWDIWLPGDSLLRYEHEYYFNWNHFHWKVTAGATLETGMRATAEGT